MNKITFMFGAGASRNALPICEEIPDRISNLINVLNSTDLLLDDKSPFERVGGSSEKSKREYQLQLIDDLNWLLNESKKHSSVDTLAKKLTIRRKFDELERLKIVLSIFFIFEQTQKPTDKRYDSFYASIIDSSGTLPENIRIISWNYDYQFELAYSEYSGKNDIVENQARLNVKQKTVNTTRFSLGFSIYKLNGSTEVFAPKRYRHFPYTEKIVTAIDRNYVEGVVKNFAGIINATNVESTLSFAWESDNEFKDAGGFIDSIIEDVKDSIALVVIGYSFPFFNREIDRKIIGAMNQLKRVYFQAPDADALVERFKAIKDDIKNIELVPKYDVDQFLLPNEL